MIPLRAFHLFHVSRRGDNGRRLFGAAILTLSSLLVLLGVTVPNLARPASPKPRPRGVVESAGKVSQEAAKRVAVVEADLACRRSDPVAPASFLTLFDEPVAAVGFTVVLLPASRAPPVVFS